MAFVVVSKLTVDCLLGADYLIANEAIIDHNVFMKGNEMSFMLAKGIANTMQPATCGTISVLKAVTIPGRSIQLIDVTLLKWVCKIKKSTQCFNQSPSYVPLYTTTTLHAARTLSPVFNNCAVIQVVNISPTSMTIYQGTKIREVAPLADIHLIKTQHSPSPAHIIPVFLDINLTESPISLTQKQ